MYESQFLLVDSICITFSFYQCYHLIPKLHRYFRYASSCLWNESIHLILHVHLFNIISFIINFTTHQFFSFLLQAQNLPFTQILPTIVSLTFSDLFRGFYKNYLS